MIEPSAPLKDALLRAFESHADGLFHHCYERLGHREQAVAAVRETFLRCWGTLRENARCAGELRPLLYRVAGAVVEELLGTPAPAADSAAVSSSPFAALHLGPAAPAPSTHCQTIRLDPSEHGAKHVSGSFLAARLRGGRTIFLSLTHYA